MRPELVDELRKQAEAILLQEGSDGEQAAEELGGQLIGSAPASAAELFEHAARIAEASQRWTQAAVAREHAVKAWIAAGRTHEAANAVTMVRTAADRVEDTDLRLRVLSNLAASMRELGLAAEGADLLRQVIDQRRVDAANDDEDVMRALAAGLVNLAATLIDQGSVAEGIAILNEAEARAKSLGEPIRLGTIKINLAVAQSATGNLRAARATYREAADLYRRGGAAFADIAYAIRGEASTLAQVGRFTEAEKLYVEAGALYAEAGLNIEVARTSIGHIMVQASLGQQIDADELEALEQQLHQLPWNEQGQLGRNLGNIANRQNDFERAERLYLLARSAFTQLDRPADVSSVDMSRAVCARRAGDAEKARRLLLDARDRVEPLKRWRQIGHIDHNLALVLSDLAEAAEPDVARQLEDEAAARSVNAVAALDRFRHDLPTAHDRATLERSVYSGLFPTAIRCAFNVRQLPLTAALVERARVQPVLPASKDAMAFLEPRPIAARPGDTLIGGSGQPVYLAQEAMRLAGPGAQWIGWWTDPDQRITSVSSTSAVRITLGDVRELDEALAYLAAALPIPTGAEAELCRGDEKTQAFLALWRAANGPLLRDHTLEAQLADVVPVQYKRASLSDERVAAATAMNDADLLWPLSRLLFDESLLEELRTTPVRLPLVLAPPPLLGRVPWAALPLSDPATGPVRRLVEAADVMVSLPASLSASLLPRQTAEGDILLVADPLDNLAAAARMRVPGVERLGKGHGPATRDAFIAALDRAATLILVAHVLPGDPFDPAASAIQLCDSNGGEESITVAELADFRVPESCVVLGCDGAGAATGNEWTGVATGLAWAGARRIVTTTWPVIDDRVTTASDETLINRIRAEGPYEGLWAWQRTHAAALRREYTRASAIYRWAGTIAIGLPGAFPRVKTPHGDNGSHG